MGRGVEESQFSNCASGLPITSQALYSKNQVYGR